MRSTAGRGRSELTYLFFYSFRVPSATADSSSFKTGVTETNEGGAVHPPLTLGRRRESHDGLGRRLGRPFKVITIEPGAEEHDEAPTSPSFFPANFTLSAVLPQTPRHILTHKQRAALSAGKQ